MGRDREQSKRRKKRPPFVLLEKDLIRHPMFRKLSSHTWQAYICIKEKYNGNNGGDISLTYGEMEDVMSRHTYSKALKELESVGLIKFVRKGGLERKCNIISLPEWKDVKKGWT